MMEYHLNFMLLIIQYKDYLNIYEFEDCTIDIYVNGDKKEDLYKKLKQSKDSKFGISVNCLQKKDIIRHFNNICALLEI